MLFRSGDREQILDLGLDPECLVQTLALGAVPVAAGVVDWVLAPAVVAALPVPSQGSGAARDQRGDDPGLVRAEVRKFPCVLGEDLGQVGTFGARRSQSLAVRHDDLQTGRCLLAPQSVERAADLVHVVLGQVGVELGGLQAPVPE